MITFILVIGLILEQSSLCASIYLWCFKTHPDAHTQVLSYGECRAVYAADPPRVHFWQTSPSSSRCIIMFYASLRPPNYHPANCKVSLGEQTTGQSRALWEEQRAIWLGLQTAQTYNYHLFRRCRLPAELRQVRISPGQIKCDILIVSLRNDSSEAVLYECPNQ